MSGMIRGLASFFNTDTVEADLVKMFQASHFDFGKALIADIKGRLGQDAEPHTVDKITIDHIKDYLIVNIPGYATTAADGTISIAPSKLERALRVARILELGRNIDATHRSRIIERAIRDKRAEKGAEDNATVFSNPLSFYEYLEQTEGEFALNDAEIGDLYSKINRQLNNVKSESPKTTEGMSVVLEVKKPVEFKDEVADFFTTVTNHFTGAYTREASKQYEEAVRRDPSIKLEELDFARNPTRHKALLMEMLENLRLAESKPGAKTRGNYQKFNTVIRKLLQTQCPNQEAKNKLEAKLHFAMGKLAIVLRNNGCIEDADKIMASTGHAPRYNTPAPLKIKEFTLPDGTINAGVVAKITAAFNKLKGFTSTILRRADLPADVRDHINLHPIQAQLDGFVAQAEAQNSPDARRKYTDRCIKVMRDIDNLYNNNDVLVPLRAANVADTDADFMSIEAIAPRNVLFSKFREDYRKLQDRTDVAVAQPGQYIAPAAPTTAVNYKNQLKEMRRKLRLDLVAINASHGALMDEQDRIQQIQNAPAHLLTAVRTSLGYCTEARRAFTQLIANIEVINANPVVTKEQFDPLEERNQECNDLLELIKADQQARAGAAPRQAQQQAPLDEAGLRDFIRQMPGLNHG